MYKPFISHQFWGIPILKHKYSQSKQRNGYGSIPINTIFRGMNIHKSQLFWCELQGYTVLTHCQMVVNSLGALRWNCSQSQGEGFSQGITQGGSARRDLENMSTKWGPQTIAKLVYNSNNYGYLRTINHSDIGVMFTNLAIVWGPHLVGFLKNCGNRKSSMFLSDFPWSKPSSYWGSLF